jgi:pyridoxal phosphate enzyme (YggS family)
MNNAAARLQNIRQRIENACAAAGRKAVEVALLAVSKRQGADKIAALNELGITAFGENQLQEALDKQQQLESLALQWHFIGAIQSNKTRAIANHFQWVQSVDRPRILRRLANQRPPELPPLNILLQVNIDREPQKAGADPAEIPQLAALAGELDNVRLRGLMAIPKLTPDRDQQRDSFQRVRLIYEELLGAGHDLDTLSMGMSADLEAAIEAGSTMVRIGTDLFGPRNP